MSGKVAYRCNQSKCGAVIKVDNLDLVGKLLWRGSDVTYVSYQIKGLKRRKGGGAPSALKYIRFSYLAFAFYP